MKIECPNCASKLNAAEELIGKTVNCPKCKRPIAIPKLIPNPKTPPSNQDPSRDPQRAKTRVICSACQAKIAVPDALLGKTVNCPKCKEPIKLAPARIPSAPPHDASTTTHSNPDQAPAALNDQEPNFQSESTRKRNPAPILIGLAGLIAVSLISGLLYWFLIGQRNPSGKQITTSPSMPSIESSESAPEDDAPTLQQPAPEPEPANQAIPPFELGFDFGKPETNLVYDFEFRYSQPDTGESSISGKSIDRMNYQESDFMPRGENGIRQSDPLPLEEIATGLGIPGRRVIVSYVAARDAEDIQIKIGTETYSAEVIEEHPDDGFLVLDFQSPGLQDHDFAPPKVARKDEIFGHLNMIRVNPQGETELLENLESWQRGGPWQVVLKKAPRNWRTGLVIQHWGSIAGILTQQKETHGIVNINRITKHFDDATFDFKPMTDPVGMADIQAQIQHNLVQVTVKRLPSVMGIQHLNVALFHDHNPLNTPPFMWEKLDEPNRSKFASMELRRNGTYKSRPFPAALFLESLTSVPIIKLKSGTYQWDEEQLVAFGVNEYSRRNEIEDPQPKRLHLQ